jgi:hypothetical protein
MRESLERSLGMELVHSPVSSLSPRFLSALNATDEERDFFKELRRLRNSIVHGTSDDISDEAITISIERARELIRTIRIRMSWRRTTEHAQSRCPSRSYTLSITSDWEGRWALYVVPGSRLQAGSQGVFRRPGHIGGTCGRETLASDDNERKRYRRSLVLQSDSPQVGSVRNLNPAYRPTRPPSPRDQRLFPRSRDQGTFRAYERLTGTPCRARPEPVRRLPARGAPRGTRTLNFTAPADEQLDTGSATSTLTLRDRRVLCGRSRRGIIAGGTWRRNMLAGVAMSSACRGRAWS